MPALCALSASRDIITVLPARTFLTDFQIRVHGARSTALLAFLTRAVVAEAKSRELQAVKKAMSQERELEWWIRLLPAAGGRDTGEAAGPLQAAEDVAVNLHAV